MAFQVIKNNGVAELMMDKPPVNAFSSQDLEELAPIVSALGEDPKIKVIIIYAVGRGFCGGSDIKELAENPACVSKVNRAAFNAFKAIHRCQVPVISAVHGFALGTGAAIVGSSDIVIASEGAKFGLPEINVGMLGGASHMLRILPLSKVRTMYYTGQPIRAEEMYRLGAIEKVVPKEILLETARELAKEIASKSSIGLRLAKEALNAIEPVDLEVNYRFEQGYTFEISNLDAGQEARKAFSEGRKPEFKEEAL